MRLQTHVKLFLREVIDNWRYIDTILLMTLLVLYVGFSDPCDRCIIKQGYNELTCKQAFLTQIGYEETGYGIKKIDAIDLARKLNLTNFSESDLNFNYTTYTTSAQ